VSGFLTAVALAKAAGRTVIHPNARGVSGFGIVIRVITVVTRWV
jgi:hypothetical protein